MKLSVWAKKQGISYITAWRWFSEGRLPVKAYRSDSGTIIVQDESETSEQVMGNNQSNDAMSMILKKTVEFSKNNGTVEDFAAWVLSNFQLKVNAGPDSPKYSRVKPKSEDIQKHFQKFIKKDEKPKPNSFVASEEVLDEIVRSDGLGDDARLAASLEVSDDATFVESENAEQLKNSLSELFVNPNTINTVTYGSVEGIVTRSVDSTPQLNYTGSTNYAPDSNFTTTSNSLAPQYQSFSNSLPLGGATVTTDSLLSRYSQSAIEADSYKAAPVPARRGRKPAKSFRK